MRESRDRIAESALQLAYAYFPPESAAFRHTLVDSFRLNHSVGLKNASVDVFFFRGGFLGQRRNSHSAARIIRCSLLHSVGAKAAGDVTSSPSEEMYAHEYWYHELDEQADDYPALE